MRDDLLKYGFDKEKVLRKARGEKLIPDDVGCWFLERNIIKKYSFEIKSFWVQNFDFDKYSYYLSWKDDIILDYYFDSNDIDTVIEYSKNKNNGELIEKVLFELYRISFFNKLVVSCCQFINPFYLDNLEVLSNLFFDSLRLMFSEDNSFKVEKEINLKQVVLLSGLYFDELDKSGVLKDKLLEMIRESKILLWDCSDDSKKADIQKRFGIPEHSIMQAHFSLESGFINIPLRGTLSDVFVLVHEFFHYYSTINYSINSNNVNGWIFREFPSMYFETNLICFLESNGFSKEDVLASYNYRNKNHLDLYSFNLDLFKFFKKFINKGKIVLNDFFKDYTKEIELLKRVAPNSELLMYAIECQELGMIGAKRDCDDLIISIMFNMMVIPRSYDYMFAKFLVDHIINNGDEFVSFMANLSYDMACIDMEPYRLLSSILPVFYLFLFESKSKDNSVKRLCNLK